MRTLAFGSLCVSLLGLTGLNGQAAPYLESGGRVVVEAEHFEKRTAEQGGDHKYVVVPDEDPGTNGPFTNARGDKFVQNIPEGGQNKNAAGSPGSDPHLDYAVQINTPGDYQLYLRTLGYDGGADSLYAQILEITTPGWYRFSPDPAGTDFALLRNDNADAATAIGWNGYGNPDVLSGDGGEVPAVWSIPRAGTYTIRITQREDSNAIDALILQLSSMPPPTNPGPPESPLAGTFVRITQEPKDATVALNGTATFTVVADGSGAVAYQWQKALPGTSVFVDVVGATSASLTTGALAVADHGAKYRVTVSIPGKSITSRDAVLSVDVVAPTVVKVSGSGNFNTITVVYAEAVGAASAGDKANYALDGGLTISSATVVDPKTVRLATSKQTAGSKYTLTVSNVKDAVGNSIVANTKVGFSGFVLSSGAVSFEAWNGITGTPLQGLLDDPRYPNTPDFTATATAFDTRTVYPNDSHENYGGRLRAFITPEQSGDYEFFIRSDDASQLFLSADDDPTKAVAVAEETGCCGAFEESGASETSAPVTLAAGKKYYIEVLWKEGGGGDYAQVAWRKAGDTTAASTLQPIPGKFLSWYVDPGVRLDITQQPVSVTAAAGSQTTFSVRYLADSFLGTTASIQWQKNGVNIAGATSQDLVINFADPADNGAKFRAVLSIGVLSTVTSSEATLTVVSDATPPALTGINGSTKSVRIGFSEPLNATTAGDKANYSIDKGATVTAAKVVSAADAAGIVQLDISGATAGSVYTVTVNKVTDKSNNPVAANSKAGFVAYTAFFDFDDGVLPAGTSAYGPAAILAGRGLNGGSALMLTPPIGSQQGGFLIPDLVGGAAVTKFTVTFKLYIGEGSGNAADGFSLNFAPDVPEATVGEEGSGSGITLSLDTYDNGGGEAPAVDVKFGGTEVATTKVPKARLVNNQYVDVMIRLYADGTLDVSHNKTNYYSKLAIPGFAPISGGRILIGARTGGEWERALVDDFAILINADPPTEVPLPVNVPAPTIAITSPASGATFAVGANVTITVSASASGGRTISKVEFFAGTTKLGESTASPYSFTVPNVPEGRYTVTAKITDSQGATTDSAPINVTVGSPPETIVLFAIDDKQAWRYDRSGKDLGTSWRDVTYNDSTWPQGRALIADETGAAAEPIRTPISRLNDAGDHITTLYVRGHFNFPRSTTSGVTLALRHVVDDGAVFYLNGVEVARFGVPAGAVTFETFSSSNENAYRGPVAISPTNLVPGDNVFAVEVHQTDANSSDIVFGAELIATVPAAPPTTTAPKFSVPAVQGGNLVLTWAGTGTLQSADAVTGPWTDVANAKSPFTATVSGGAKFYRVKQ